MRLGRCEYTGEILFGFGEFGAPLFGQWLPFLGWKWVPCHEDGSFDKDWPPRFVTQKIGFMWLGHGLFYTPPWDSDIRKIQKS